MSQTLFRVVFDGTLSGEFDEVTSKKRFSRLFRLDAKKTALFFSGKNYVIKDNLPENEAMNFMIKVSETGCECYVQEVPDGDYDEKREESERRQDDRRSPRPGARVLDRRLEVRRTRDKKYLQDLVERIKKIPVAFKAYITDSKKK